MFEECSIGRRHPRSSRSIAGDVAFGEANEVGMVDGRLRDGLFSQRYRLRGSRREADVGQCDSNRAHSSHNFDRVPV